MTTGGPESKEAISWRWAESDGTEHAATGDDLERLLRAGALPEYVLVWRTGWAEWLPAMQVAELREALGPRAQDPREPKTDPAFWTAPDPPIARYAEFGHAASVPLLQPGFAYSTPPLPVVPAPPSGEPSGPVRVRDVLPTLVESPPSSRSSTLRPAGGAVPPPARGLPHKTPLPRFEDVDRSSGAHDPAFTDSPMPRHTPSTMPEGLAPSEATIALPKLALGAAVGVGLLLVALIVVFVAHLLGNEAREGAGQTDPTASAALAASAGPLGPRRCAVDVAPKRLAHRAFAGAPAMLESIPGSNRAAAGFAAQKNRAVGLTVDSASLSVEQPFATDTAEPVLGVVPVTAGGALRFVVDQENTRLAHSRTVNHDPPFSIGVSERGLSREMGDSLEVIWPGRSDDSRITPPRVASIAGVGHAVAFRHGEQGGKVLVGWLTEGGEKLTDLKAVATAEPILGTPSIADNGTHIVLSFAAKASAGSSPWGLRLATAPLRELPERAAVFDLPSGGPGKEAIAPSAVGLDPQRFLLQWTEGASGNRVVRAQIIDTHLVPEGDPITLSPPGENSGQGALWAHGDHAIALYYVKRGNEHELWGVSLTCR